MSDAIKVNFGEVINITEAEYAAEYAGLLTRKIKVLDIPKGIPYIGGNVCRNCAELQLVNIPDSVRLVDEHAFYGCSSLKEVNFGNGVEEIVAYAFYNVALEKITFPPSLKVIGSSAFWGCTELREVTFTSTVTTNGAHAPFYNCTALETINVPWSEGEVEGAPWGATNAKINYNYVSE